MQRGVRVYWMNGLAAGYFRRDGGQRCTRQIFSLLKRGMVSQAGEYSPERVELTSAGTEYLSSLNTLAAERPGH